VTFAGALLDVVFQIVEHFCYHTGQIISGQKWTVGERARLYDGVRLNFGL